MEIIEITLNNTPTDNKKLDDAIVQLKTLLNHLRERQLPATTVAKINTEIEAINTNALQAKSPQTFIKSKQNNIKFTLEKDLKIVPKNYYRNVWIAVGMGAFGVPIGVAFGISLGNMGLLGIGLPIGLFIGSIVGTQLDKKAFAEGRQLDVELT